MAEVCAVLVVEPSDLFREFLDVIVDHAGYDVVAVDLSEGAQLLERQRFDVVILASIGMGGRVAPVQLARRATPAGARVLIALDDPSHRRAFRADGYTMLNKPFMPRTLIDALEQLRRHYSLYCGPRVGT